MIVAYLYDDTYRFIRRIEGFSVDLIIAELEYEGFKGYMVVQSDLPAGEPKKYHFS